MSKSKSFLYANLIERLDIAHGAGFFLESCWLAHAIFEDRTRSIIANSGDGTDYGKELAGKIETIQKRLKENKARVVQGKPVKNKITGNKEKIPKWSKLHTVNAGMLDELDKWRRDRNDLAHAMANGTKSYEQVYAISASLSDRGAKLTREVCSAAMRVKQHSPK